MPADLEFTMINTDDESLTMYLINEPIPEGFRPNENMLVRDENTIPIGISEFMWAHIVQKLFSTEDGLGTLESVLTVVFDSMTIGRPHNHNEGTEKVWTTIKGTSIAFLGKQIRWQSPETGYMIPLTETQVIPTLTHQQIRV